VCTKVIKRLVHS